MSPDRKTPNKRHNYLLVIEWDSLPVLCTRYQRFSQFLPQNHSVITHVMTRKGVGLNKSWMSVVRMIHDLFKVKVKNRSPSNFESSPYYGSYYTWIVCTQWLIKVLLCFVICLISHLSLVVHSFIRLFRNTYFFYLPLPKNFLSLRILSTLLPIQYDLPSGTFGFPVSDLPPCIISYSLQSNQCYISSETPRFYIMCWWYTFVIQSTVSTLRPPFSCY